jgi:hypothetical protein
MITLGHYYFIWSHVVKGQASLICELLAIIIIIIIIIVFEVMLWKANAQVI